MSAYSIASRNLPQGTLTPMNTLLFAAGEQGAWYDPSDMSTLYQDSAGTTPVTAVEQPVGRMLDKSGRGNHAAQSTTTKRPIYSRRVNLLNKTEVFTFAGIWQGQANGQETTDGFPGPSGKNNACRVVDTTGNVAYVAQAAGITYSVGVKYRATIYVAPYNGAVSATMYSNFTNSGGAFRTITVNLSTGTFSVSNSAELLDVSVTLVAGFWRISYEGIAQRTTGHAVYPSLTASVVGTGLFVAEPSLTLATDSHLPYQRVNTDTDYDADPAKFPAYQRADGVDDSLASSTGGGGTIGFFFSAAISPRGSAGTARTLFSDAGTNTGYIVRLNASNQLELSAGNGTAYTTIATAGTLAVGSTGIVQAWDDGTNLNVKIGNGPTASIARPTVSAGTAGYTMGQDNGASTGYFNGRIYSTIYRKDSGLTQVQREAVALYQRQKARIA